MATPPPAGAPWPTLREHGRQRAGGSDPRRGRGRRGALVPAGLRAARAGDAVQFAPAGRPDRARAAAGELQPNRGPAPRRCSCSTTGSTPTRGRCRATRRVVNAYEPLLRARARVRADPRAAAEPASRSTSTAAATRSGSSTRSTGCEPGAEPRVAARRVRRRRRARDDGALADARASPSGRASSPCRASRGAGRTRPRPRGRRRSPPAARCPGPCGPSTRRRAAAAAPPPRAARR